MKQIWTDFEYFFILLQRRIMKNSTTPVVVLVTISSIEIYISMVLLIVVILLSTPLNLVTAVAIRKKRVLSVNYILMMHLCIANLLMSFFAPIFTLVTFILLLQNSYNEIVCFLRHISIFAGIIANVCYIHHDEFCEISSHCTAF